MKNTPFKNYGFNYTYNEKNYAFHVAATSINDAKGRVRAMSEATLFGELQESVLGQANEVTEQFSANSGTPAHPAGSLCDGLQPIAIACSP